MSPKHKMSIPATKIKADAPSGGKTQASGGRTDSRIAPSIWLTKHGKSLPGANSLLRKPLRYNCPAWYVGNMCRSAAGLAPPSHVTSSRNAVHISCLLRPPPAAAHGF